MFEVRTNKTDTPLCEKFSLNGSSGFSDVGAVVMWMYGCAYLSGIICTDGRF